MKKINTFIIFTLVSVLCASAHDLKYDTFMFNDEDSTCVLISTEGLPPTKYDYEIRKIARVYEEYINGYKFIAVGRGLSYLDYLSGTSSISLPASIEYINAYSLCNIGIVTMPRENNLKYIGEYAFSQGPFANCQIYINKNCNFHENAFVLSTNSTSSTPSQLHGNKIEIDPENPYWGLEDGMLFQKDSVNIVRYFVHKTHGDTIEIPKRFTTINQISTCPSYWYEDICFEDVSALKKLSVKYCNITNDDEVWNVNNMDTVYFELSECKFKVKKMVFPNAKYVSTLYLGSPKINHLVLMNVSEIENSNGQLFSGTADTLSIHTTQLLGNKLFVKADIGRLNWLNEEVPFAESMEEYADRIDVLNLGNAKVVGIKGLMYSLKARNTESSILLSTPTPPEVQSMVLYDDYPSNVKLYVPAGSGETYRNHEKWGIIPTIIEYDVNGPDPTSGIGTIINDNEQSLVDVYNLQGVLMRKGVQRSEATQGLPQGIYVIGGKKVIVK